ncbi:MAG: hypothetical protein WCV62_06760 [Candidatus Peribacteraceae bacterium]|jgi:uncharacterized Zn finger protein (UPF0148 family)
MHRKDKELPKNVCPDCGLYAYEHMGATLCERCHAIRQEAQFDDAYEAHIAEIFSDRECAIDDTHQREIDRWLAGGSIGGQNKKISR